MRTNDESKECLTSSKLPSLTTSATSFSGSRMTRSSTCRSMTTGDDELNPIASTAAFAHFQQDHADRREGSVDQQTATLVGAYITTID